MLLAQLVLAFLGLQEAVELFLLLALDVLLELLLIIGKVLGLKWGEGSFNNCKQKTYNTDYDIQTTAKKIMLWN